VCYDLLSSLLPADGSLHLDVVQLTDAAVRVVATATAPRAACPDCAASARRVHSRYRRVVADLPWAGRRVTIELRVRRFLCPSSACARMTFAERLPEVAPLHARATVRLLRAQADAGLALGGAAGARLLARHGLPGSRNTLLRRVRALPEPPVPPPRAIGLDDWAQRKRHRYGSIVVDLDRHRPIALLAERSADEVSAWLRAHPSVALVSRDRAEGFASAIGQGAPQAVQVADRWHVLKNLREATEVALAQRPALPWRPAAEVDAAPPLDATAGALLPGAPDTPSGRREEAARLARRAQRLARYEQVAALREQGYSAAVIAARTGLGLRTVQTWLAAGRFPERQRRRDRSCLDPYRSYLLARWEAGCRNAAHLWREIRAQGFPGSYGLVAGLLAPLRRGRAARRSARLATTPPPEPAAVPTMTARSAAFLLVRRPADRTAEEQEVLARVRADDPVVGHLAGLTETFAAMVRERASERLDSWLEEAGAGPVAELRRFANGIRKDYTAIKAALESPHSNGQTEGHVTRLKLYKRQMYGRAKIDLLRKRVLHAS
jgi:transposase